MIVRQGCKYRLYPDREQQEELAVQFGHARYVYNRGGFHKARAGIQDTTVWQSNCLS